MKNLVVFILSVFTMCFTCCSDGKEIDNPDYLKGYYAEGHITVAQHHSFPAKPTSSHVFFPKINNDDYSQAIDFGEGSEKMYDYLGSEAGYLTTTGSASILDSLYKMMFISNKKFEISSSSEFIEYNEGETYPCNIHSYKFKEGEYIVNEPNGYRYFFVTSNSVKAKKHPSYSEEIDVLDLDNFVYRLKSNVDYSKSPNFKTSSFKYLYKYEIQEDDRILFWNDDIRMEGKVDMYTLKFTLKQTYPTVGSVQTYILKK